VISPANSIFSGNIWKNRIDRLPSPPKDKGVPTQGLRLYPHNLMQIMLPKGLSFLLKNTFALRHSFGLGLKTYKSRHRDEYHYQQQNGDDSSD
jgi:hypothetical protein